MKLTIRPSSTDIRVANTPEALFKAAGVLALAGLLLVLLNPNS